jgi:predicted PurR-regulated permease PerM
MFSLPNQQEPHQHSTTPTSVWTRRLIILLTILAALALGVALLWIAGHIITSLLILAVAALLAYAIAPAVDLLHRVMPRPIAILVVYLIVIALLGFLIYLIVRNTVTQLISLAESMSRLLIPSSNGQDSPLVRILLSIGLSHNQIQAIALQLGSQLTNVAGTVAGGVLPLLSSVASGLVNILLTVVISIYLLVDGSRAVRWLRDRTPASQRGRIGSMITIIQNVVGGYIRGQITLCFIVGVLVGVGMAILGMPYAVLLGVLTFITEFIPVLGTIVAGTISVLLALTQGWLTAVLVLAYFVLVHIFEGYVLAPRLLGKAVGLHPLVSLLALIIGAELFGPWGAIFASPTAGLIQAFVLAFWISYRRAHKDEFPSEGGEPAHVDKGVEELATSMAPPTVPAGDTSPRSE